VCCKWPAVTAPSWSVTDLSFSMDATWLPFRCLLAWCERHVRGLVGGRRARLCWRAGTKRSGSLAHWAFSSERIVYIGTLGQAAGVFGGVRCGKTPNVVIGFFSGARNLHVHDGQPAAARPRRCWPRWM